MHECQKSIQRRLHDPAFHQFYFVGDGIDIGGGYDGLDNYVKLFPRIRSVKNWDVKDGDAQLMAGVPDALYDFVHCVVPGQRVRTPDGLLPIERVRVGDAVLGYSGFVRVRRVYRMPYRGGVMRLETPQGVAVVTTNHPIATPLGWVQANQLRSSGQVAAYPTEVQASDLVDGRHIFRRITRPAALLAKRPMLIVVGGATLREREHELGLPFLPDQVGQDLSEHDTATSPAAMDYDALAGLGIGRAGLRLAPAMAHDGGGKDVAHAAQDLRVGVHDLDLGLDAARADAEGDASLAIDYSGEPRPVRLTQLHDLNIHPYRGDVWNLETDDGTFVLEGILTHNSSHCLEHLRDPIEAMVNWWRILKVGGHLIVMVPDEDLYEQGVWPSTFNGDHKRTFTLWKYPGLGAEHPKASWSPVSENVFSLASMFTDGKPLSVRLLESTFIRGIQRCDQTQGAGECAIEFIVRKLPS